MGGGARGGGQKWTAGNFRRLSRRAQSDSITGVLVVGKATTQHVTTLNQAAALTPKKYFTGLAPEPLRYLDAEGPGVPHIAHLGALERADGVGPGIAAPLRDGPGTDR